MRLSKEYFRSSHRETPLPLVLYSEFPSRNGLKKKKKRKEMDGGNALNAQMVHYCGPGFNPWFGN